MAGTFTIPEFNSSYTITDSNLVRIGDKNFLKENNVLFYLIFTSENYLNVHSSLIKPHMSMSFGPLNCPCQGASSEQQKMGPMAGIFLISEFNSSFIITSVRTK
jgi:hypothetical protein